MRYGLSVPCFGEELRFFGELARAVEGAGWDGLFLWDHIRWRDHYQGPILDPWVLLGVAAMLTDRIRLGTLITPPARRRAAKLAKETVTLDRLSRGRLVLGVGLGWPPDVDFGNLGDELNNRVRAEIFEETLDALVGFWSAEPFAFEGKHLHISTTHLTPGPVQQPHPPVWVGAKWPNRKPFLRAARWDGVAPVMDGRAMTPADMTELLELIEQERGSLDDYDVVCGGRSEPGTAGAEHIASFVEAGITWWVEAMKPEGDWQAESLRRAAAGPSR